MKAIYIERFGPSDVLLYGDRPQPAPRPDEVLIEVHATSVNPRDWLIRSGRYPFQRLLPPLPLILGSDVAGVVAEVGEKVERFQPGDDVYAMQPTSRGFGAYAELAAVTESALARKPRNMSWEEAAGVPLAGLTAWQALRGNARMKAGDKVLVVGASGGVGHYAVQIARALGAEVTGVCSTANLELVQSLGAHRVIDYQQERFHDLPGRYDVVFDVIGRESPKACAPVLRPGGTYVTTIPGPGTLFAMVRSRLVSALFRRARRAEVILVASRGSDLEALAELIEAGKLETVVDTVYPLAEAAKAHAKSRTFRTRGKLVLKVR